jgi:hypothetical protein
VPADAAVSRRRGVGTVGEQLAGGEAKATFDLGQCVGRFAGRALSGGEFTVLCHESILLSIVLGRSTVILISFYLL